MSSYNNLFSIFCVICATFLFTGQNIYSRFLSEHLNNVQVTFVLYVWALIIMIPFAIIKRLKFDWSIQYLNLLRSLCSVIGNLAVFYSISKLPLTHVTVLFLTTSIFTTLLAIIFLHERINMHIIISLLTGFSGVLIVIEPWDNLVFSPISFLALLSAFMWSLEDIIIKINGRKESIASHIFYFTLFRVLLFIFPAMMLWGAAIDPKFIIDISIYGFIGSFVGVVGIVLCYNAFRDCDISILTPFYFLSIVFAIIFSYFLFDEVIKINTIIGALLICISSMYLTYYNYKHQSHL